MKTRSETQFEDYCIHRGYSFDRIELGTAAGRRADYRLHLPSGDAICEVKQIEPGPWEKGVEERLNRHGSADLSRAIGGRAGAMIQDAAPQLKRHRGDGIPLLIFAMDLTGHDHLSEVDIDAAMFGKPTIRFYVGGNNADDRRPHFRHGGGRQMTEQIRLYISALCVMQHHCVALKIFHNPFAEYPLFPHYFPHGEDTHFIKGDHPEKVRDLWCEYVGPRAEAPS